jgi:hypothetical protein
VKVTQASFSLRPLSARIAPGGEPTVRTSQILRDALNRASSSCDDARLFFEK